MVPSPWPIRLVCNQIHPTQDPRSGAPPLPQPLASVPLILPPPPPSADAPASALRAAPALRSRPQHSRSAPALRPALL